MTFLGQLLRPGESTLPQQQNASQVVIPFHGNGHSIVGGKQFDWEPFDAVAVPAASGTSTSTARVQKMQTFSSPATSRH